MKKSLLFLIQGFIISLSPSFSEDFAPAAGQAGSTAIHKDSSIIKSWATGVEIIRGWVNIADTSAKANGTNKASYGVSSNALGVAQGNSFHVVSLGDGGIVTLTFDRPIINGPGPDFTIFENGFSDTFLELAFVEVSSDGKRFVRFPSISLTPTNEQVGGFGTLDPTKIHNLTGKYRQGYGTPFDLEDIKDSTGIDIYNIRFVRIIDVVGSIDQSYATYDSKGNKVNDPWPTPYASSGFDLDAVGVINFGQPYSIATFDELNLNPDSYWNGSSGEGKFESGLAVFPNSYNSSWGTWEGFAYSNMRDDSTAGWTNQFSAITRGGINAPDTGGTNYVVAYVGYSPMPITFKNGKSHVVSGFYITNSTYAYLSMKNGDMFAKKFGGTSENDPDFFKLLIWGERESVDTVVLTDTIEFYLADFRFDDNSKDYIVDNWRWIDLTSLGKITKLYFGLESSDVGMWGMNTPAYFCIDNFTVFPDAIPVKIAPMADISVPKNSSPVEVDLSKIFTSYFDEINYEYNYTNSNLFSVTTGSKSNILVLQFNENQVGEDDLIIVARINDAVIYDTIHITVYDSIIDMAPIAEKKKVNIFPNPFQSVLNVTCKVGDIIAIYDVYGKNILNRVATTDKEVFDMHNLPSGIYIINVKGESSKTSFKVIKR